MGIVGCEPAVTWELDIELELAIRKIKPGAEIGDRHGVAAGGAERAARG